MIPNLPLDVNNKQIREGDTVVFGADNGSYLHVGKVFKITPCFVWMKLPHPFDAGNFRREFRRVAVLETTK